MEYDTCGDRALVSACTTLLETPVHQEVVYPAPFGEDSMFVVEVHSHQEAAQSLHLVILALGIGVEHRGR
jgi:hypothetical protein